MPTSTKIITDSVSESGVRLCTLVLEYPRIIHSEVMTHRMFSRNASSSRAIPVEKQIERLTANSRPPGYFYPTDLRINQKGMQGDFEVTDFDYKHNIRAWEAAKDFSITQARVMLQHNAHKQSVNRLLEPFSFIQVIVTATEWDNFFLQRLDKNAQPEIQELARVMKEAMDGSTPKLLKTGEWHLPFIGEDEDKRLYHEWYSKGEVNTRLNNAPINELLRQVSVARCARVSYGLNERGWGDIEKDLALYDMLLTNNHWSPFEHQATPMKLDGYSTNGEVADLFEERGITHFDKNWAFWSGNFKGWIQNRQLIQQSN